MVMAKEICIEGIGPFYLLVIIENNTLEQYEWATSQVKGAR